MSASLRSKNIDGQQYVHVNDLLNLMLDVMTMDSLHPVAVEAIDGLAVGLCLNLGITTLLDLPENLQQIIKNKGEK